MMTNILYLARMQFFMTLGLIVFLVNVHSCQPKAEAQVIERTPFIRGDATMDGRILAGDPVAILDHVFVAPSLTCEDAADADDNGWLDLADVVYLLRFIYVRESPPPAPFPDPGFDPTPDGLACSV